MSTSRLCLSRTQTHSGAVSPLRRTEVESRPRSSPSVLRSIRTVSDALRRKRKPTLPSESDEGNDSDATLDLEEGLSGPILQGCPPLQRMATEYERLILRSLSQGKTFTYACTRCLDEDERQEISRRSEDSDLSGDSGDSLSGNGSDCDPSLTGHDGDKQSTRGNPKNTDLEVS